MEDNGKLERGGRLHKTNLKDKRLLLGGYRGKKNSRKVRRWKAEQGQTKRWCQGLHEGEKESTTTIQVPPRLALFFFF